MTTTQKLALTAGVFLTAALAFWLDQTHSAAAVWVLLALSSSTGFAHGALDAALVFRQFRARAVWLLLAYLALVILLGWVLSYFIGLALWLLLLLSAWHFGESYARWQGLPAGTGLLTRVVVGGAPVMLPVWLGGDAFVQTLQGVVSASALDGWRMMSAAWLGLLLLWAVLCGLRQLLVTRFAWCEVLGCMWLYLAFSPLMAFALYFGAYHAPVHVWRVWRAMTQAKTAATQDAPNPKRQAAALLVLPVAATLLFTWLLGGLLAWQMAWQLTWQMGWQYVGAVQTGLLLQWLIVALTALTVPHLVLISVLAADLSGRDDAIKK